MKMMKKRVYALAVSLMMLLAIPGLLARGDADRRDRSAGISTSSW